MAQPHNTILNNLVVKAAIRQAWQDSSPGVSGGHEEGGFITQAANGNLQVSRWQRGTQDTIRVPSHPNCKIGDEVIVASFHTHPNTGEDYLQEPSETDKRAVRDDTNLKDVNYVGEFVISQEVIFLITPAGRVRELADAQDILEGDS